MIGEKSMFKREVIHICKRSIYFQLKTQTSLKIINTQIKYLPARKLIARCYQIS